MNKIGRHSRREFLALGTALASAGLAPRALSQASMPTRPVPSTGEALPIIGLGSSKVVSEIADHGSEPLAGVLRTLVEHGGKVVDTWPRDAENDAGFGRVINQPDLRGELFVTTKIDQVGREVGIEQFRQAQRNYQREQLDLTQIFSLTDVDTHWPTLQELKAAGETRYIGVTVSEYSRYEQLADFVGRATPDFAQVNYSITERRAEERLIPMLADRGIAVIINRPFMNGAYFDRLENEPLPDWAAEFGCETWAQFSLKYILAEPGITCVLTEPSNPVHMAENAMTALGPVPSAAARARMRSFIDQI
jgi:diketogulonate reductase-like aldo/keto reductase